MDQERTIKELNSQVSTLNDKIARGGPSFGMSFQTQSDYQNNKRIQEEDAEYAAQKKQEMANNFGVPQELLDFLK